MLQNMYLSHVINRRVLQIDIKSDASEQRNTDIRFSMRICLSSTSIRRILIQRSVAARRSRDIARTYNLASTRTITTVLAITRDMISAFLHFCGPVRDCKTHRECNLPRKRVSVVFKREKRRGRESRTERVAIFASFVPYLSFSTSLTILININ